MGLRSCSLWRNKVGGWPDLVKHGFWVWSSLGVGTVSLKFRQFKSAVCDAFWGDFVLWGCSLLVWFVEDWVCFMRCWCFRAICFWPLYCWIDGWGLIMWLNTKLLVVNCLLRTCILFTPACTATTTGPLTLGVAFWLSLHVITLSNLGCVGYMIEACTVLRLHWLVVNYLLSCGHLVVSVGLWHNFCILRWLVRLKECKR